MNCFNKCQLKHVLMRKRNVSHRRYLFYTQKQMFNNEINTENNHLGGYVFCVFLPTS